MTRIIRSTKLAIILCGVGLLTAMAGGLGVIVIQNQRIANLHTALSSSQASNATLTNNYVKAFDTLKKHGVSTSGVMTPAQLAKLKGANGANGLNGATGSEGPQGPPGVDGVDGASGTNGANGLTGSAGTNGTDGTDGTNGADGATGATGPAGATGAQGPQGVSVTSIDCEPDDTWLVTYSDGTTSVPNGTCIYSTPAPSLLP